MTRSDACVRFRELILESPAVPPPALVAHLSSCPGCEGLHRAHLAALALEGHTPRLARRVRPRVVLARAGVAMAAVVAVVSLSLLAGRSGDEAPAEPPRAELVPAPEAPVTPWPAGVRLATAAELISGDPVLEPFGQLPRWLAPTSSSPMRALGRTAVPMLDTMED